MTTSFSLEFIGSKFTDIDSQIFMKDIASNKNYLYISGEGIDGTGAYELWRSDGTDSGTTLVKDINPGPGYSDPTFFTVMEDIATNTNYLYFVADDGTNGQELWRTDGTESGTTLVKDINNGGDSSPFQLTVMKDIDSNKNYLYFQATNGTNGSELWRSDGTESETTLVKDIRTGFGSFPTNLTVMEDIANNKNYLYFSANNGTNATELWRSDGTDSGTTLVKDIWTGGSSNPFVLTVMEDISSNKNYLYFTANNGTDGSELWRSDGTESGTTLVKDIRDGGSSVPYHLTVMEDIATNTNYLYFRADDGTHGKELWRSDGTENGTTLVKDIRTGGTASSISELTVMKDIASNKNYLYFRADNGTDGNELWRSDGTENGTILVKDIRTGGSSNPYELVVMKDIASNKNYLYFTANDGINGEELWRSDGTPEGTTFTAYSIEDNQYGTSPYSYMVMKDTTTNTNYLYFAGMSDSDSFTFGIYRLVITNPSTVSVEPIICFKEGTQILTLDLNTGLDTYKNIENINVGDLVSTYKHGNVPVNIIGYSILNNPLSNARISDKMYVYKKEDQPELIEDLYMTGGHCVLRDDNEVNILQRNLIESENGGILYKTDDKVRMMAKLDYRCDTVDDNREYRVWHICLDHENETMNYGIYANGMLVESTCERHAQNFLHKKENVVELIKDQCNLTSLLV